MTRACRSCGRFFEAPGSWAHLCKPCWIEREKRRDFDSGYAAGKRDARLIKAPPQQIDVETLRELRLLAHPDLHSPARQRLATKVTAWLNDQLDQRRRAT